MALALCGLLPEVSAQVPAKLEYALAAVSPLAEKRLESVEDFLKAGQWAEAFAVLDEVFREHERELVEIAPGRYVHVPHRISELTAALTGEGLAAYRRRVDARADLLLREAERSGDEARYERVVRELFASSAGDEALWALGELRWASGEIVGARRAWQCLDPQRGGGLSYPGPEQAEPLVLARLILCDLLLGDGLAGDARMDRLRERFPDSMGTIGGRTGRLTELLENLRRERAQPGWEEASLPWLSVGDVGERRFEGWQWSAVTGRDESRAEAIVDEVPTSFDGGLLLASNERVRALSLLDGQPAWPSGQPNDDGTLLDGDPVPLDDAWPRPLHRPAVAGGRGFVRIGVGGKPNRLSLLRNDTSRIVAFDLGRGEGKLLWSTPADGLSSSEAWAFASSPIVVDDTARGDAVLAVVRTPGTESLCGVACLSAETGEALWVRPVCSVIAEADPMWGRELLVHSSGRVILNLLGFVAALSVEDGRLEWIVRADESASASEELLPRVTTLHPLATRGQVYVSLDRKTAVALDLTDGRQVWTTDCPGRIDGAIASRDGVVVFSGESLWGLEQATGRILWRFGFDDPAARGAGPGWPAGRDLFWATAADLFTVDIRTGAALHRVPLSERSPAMRGGWVTGGHDRLILAAPEGVHVFRTAPIARP